ncbi:unnamed protein product [Ectocarpus fasciculatus]
MKGPRCIVEGCESVASRAPPGGTAGVVCIQHSQPGMVNLINWTQCSGSNCGKYPTYGVEGTSNREYCREHALAGMVDVHRKKCGVESCPKRASHGVKGTGKRQYCAMHAPEGMTDVGQKFCRFSSQEEGDCESIARYGVRGSKKREFCSQHAPDWMVNMNDKLCIFGDCSKLPTYGQRGTKVRQYCSQHAPSDTVNVTHRLCAEPSCTSQPTYGTPGSRKREFCRRHALEGMTDLAHKTCAHAGCKKHPKYGVQGSSSNRREFCREHALAGMVHLGNKKCMQRGCQRRPDHGNPGTKKPEFCPLHAREGMVKVADVVTAAPLAPDSTQNTEKRKIKPNPSEHPVDLRREKRNRQSVVELPGFTSSGVPPAVAPATGPLHLRAVATPPAVLTTFSSTAASGASSATAAAAAAAAVVAAAAAARGVAMSTGAVGGLETAGRARVLQAAPRGATGDTRRSAMAFQVSPGSSGGSTGMTAGLRAAQQGGLGASRACQGSADVSAVHNGGVVAGAVADYQGRHGAPAAFKGYGADGAGNVTALHGVTRGAVGQTNFGSNSTGFSALHGQAGGEAASSGSVFPQGASEMPAHRGLTGGRGEGGGAAAAIGFLPSSQPPGGAGGNAMYAAAERDVNGGVVVPHSEKGVSV